jgi:hypothetical protein
MESVHTGNTGVNQRAVLLSFVAGVTISALIVLMVLLNTENFVFIDEAKYCVDYRESAEELQDKVEDLTVELLEEKGPPGFFDIVYNYWLG